MPLFPHPIYGTITNGDGIRLKFKNLRTKDILTTLVDVDKHFIVDAANFENGYLNTDEIEMTLDDLPVYTENITIDNGDLRIR